MINVSGSVNGQESKIFNLNAKEFRSDSRVRIREYLGLRGLSG